MVCKFRSCPGGVVPSVITDAFASDSLKFEFLTTRERPLYASMSTAFFQPPERAPFSPVFDIARAAASNVETDLRVARIKGDGRCMFRALAQGMARNQGRFLGPSAEEQEADQLRLAVAEALCRTHKRRSEFGSAVIAVEAEDTIQNYCKRILSPTFWGGEPELLILSQMLKVPIYVYLVNSGKGKGVRGFTVLQKYGEKYLKAGKDWKKRKPVRLLYTNGNHYDLLLRS